MIVEIPVPDRDWWQLCDVAEARGVRVVDMLRAAVADVVEAAWTPDDLVKRWVLAGFPDGEISKRTGMTVADVAHRRRRMGLAANKRFPSRAPRNERTTA